MALLEEFEEITRDLNRLEKYAPPPPPKPTGLKKAIAQIPTWGQPLLKPNRYKALYGGRGGGKSIAVADALLILASQKPLRVLCCREYQNSIRDSSHYLLSERIDALGLAFEVQRDRIIGSNGSEFLFKGVRHNISSIKSMASIDICWVEEAQTISAESWRILKPTIRADNSEIWVTFNPNEATDPVYKEFAIQPDHCAAYIREVQWSDNPYFPSVLDDERRAMQSSDPDAYAHIWEGQLWSKSDAQIFKGKWIVEEFTPGDDWHGPYYGADFGFAKDPTALVKCWVYGDRLYLEQESFQVGLDIDQTAARWERDSPGCSQYAVRGDSARPDSISYLRRHGIPKIIGAVKGAGSIKDGIAFIRSFEQVVIHPNCPRLIEEFRLYRYKVDPKSEQVLPIIVDSFNHCLVPGTLITTERGDVPIEKVTTQDRVLTRKGYRRVLWAGVSDYNRQVYRVKTFTGKSFEATENHKVFTQRGWLRVDALRYADEVITTTHLTQCKKENLLNTADLAGTGTQPPKSEPTGYIFSQPKRKEPDLSFGCTERFGVAILALFRSIITSTTKMAIRLITQSKTLSACLAQNTCLITPPSTTQKTGELLLKGWIEFGLLQKPGTPAKRGLNGIENTPVNLGRRTGYLFRELAISVGRYIRLIPLLQKAMPVFAQTNAKRNTGGKAALMILKSHAPTATTSLLRTSTGEPRLAVDRVQTVCATRVSSKVYDLTVEGEHEFFANGVLVHNCTDALRYSLEPLMKAWKERRVTAKKKRTRWRG